eukprot:TRINITY_DN29514_c0_g1_i1.p1 TRINITY_DN29514_c0_g1~~TRINITY_DN29514_c0_g1_i1.p1  ORF type:complete len:377 (+),score=66.68 TRINITY_DN29514_c0_g1_i1:158-1288(+)
MACLGSVRDGLQLENLICNAPRQTVGMLASDLPRDSMLLGSRGIVQSAGRRALPSLLSLRLVNSRPSIQACHGQGRAEGSKGDVRSAALRPRKANHGVVASMERSTGRKGHEDRMEPLGESASTDLWRLQQLICLAAPLAAVSFFLPTFQATALPASDLAVPSTSLASPSLLSTAGNPVYGEVASYIDFSVQFLYLGSLLLLLGAGSFLVIRQVLVRRELEMAAKELQERVRSGQASCEEYFELGAVMLRKKFYLMANRYLEQAITKWDGDDQDLAQVHNALGYSYFSEEKYESAQKQYQKALQIQPAYVTAWNNLGNLLETKKDWAGALKSYESALKYDPENKVAVARRDGLKMKVAQRLPGGPSPTPVSSTKAE